MVQLTKDLTRAYELGDINEYPILGGEVIYQGAAIGLEVASGYVRSLQAGDKFVGFAEDSIDASNASDGEKSIRVKRRGSVTLELSGAAITDVGKSLYAVDDNTFTLSSAGSSVYIGQISRHQYDSEIIVDFDSANIPPAVV